MKIINKGKRCPACKKINSEATSQCSHCGENIENVQFIEYNPWAEENNKIIQSEETPFLPKILFTLSILNFLGGITLCLEFWPSQLHYENNMPYILSIGWFISGLISAVLFAALGQGLNYLHKIMKNTSQPLKEHVN